MCHLTRDVDGAGDAALIDLLFSAHVNNEELLALLQQSFEISVGDLVCVCKRRGRSTLREAGKHTVGGRLNGDLRFSTTVRIVFHQINWMKS